MRQGRAVVQGHADARQALGEGAKLGGGGHGLGDAVDEQPQDGAAAAVAAKLDVDELEALARGQGPGDGAHALEDVVLASHVRLPLWSPENKKSGPTAPTFS